MSIVGVRAVGVTKRFSTRGTEVVALAPFDLTLVPGQMLAVTGPSLSGKTTLVNLLAGWEHPDAGSVEWEGADASPPHWSELSVVPQALAMIDELNVLENITLPDRNGPDPDPGELARILGALGLDRLVERSVDEISVGERQRVMVARALAGHATVILADEPVAHQDQRNADAVLGLLLERAQRGAICLVATREREVAAVAHRSITLD